MRKPGADVRLEAATVLGELQETGLLELAKQLASDKSPKCDASSTRRGADVGQPSRARDGSAAPQNWRQIRRPPSGRLHSDNCSASIRISSLPLIDQTISSEDALVRSWAAQALVAKPTLAETLCCWHP